MSPIIPNFAYLCQQQAEYVVTETNALSTYPQLIQPIFIVAPCILYFI